MLLTQRAYAEGGRAMLYEAAAIADGIYLVNKPRKNTHLALS